MSSQSATAVTAAARSIIYLGMDVHKDSITIAVLPVRATTPTRVDRLLNELPMLKRYLERVMSCGVEKRFSARFSNHAEAATGWRRGSSRHHGW
jgi:hypothetical protein